VTILGQGDRARSELIDDWPMVRPEEFATRQRAPWRRMAPDRRLGASRTEMPGTRPGTGIYGCQSAPIRKVSPNRTAPRQGPRMTRALCLRPGALPAPLRLQLRLAPSGAFGGAGVALASGRHGFTISFAGAAAPTSGTRGQAG